MVNAQKKGKDFEREIANDLGKQFGTKVRRTPCSGGLHDFMSQDIICINTNSVLNELHIECKKQQSLNGHAVYWRTKNLAPHGKVACVVWKKNFDPEPVVIVGYADFLNYLKIVDEYQAILRENEK